MILLDFNQVILSSSHVAIASQATEYSDISFIRHLSLNTIRALNLKFRDQYGPMVIATDAPNNWRRKIFPPYKGVRKQEREKSSVDWNTIFNNLNTIRDELREYFPYPVIHVDGAEADDIIGHLVVKHGSEPFSKIIILSGDKDFAQLHLFAEQYDPVKKKFLTTNYTEDSLLEFIIKGDRGDGVPNVLSDDTCLIEHRRQQKMTVKKLDELTTSIKLKQLEITQPNVFRNFKRNEQLISLREIPLDIREKIDVEFDRQQGKDRAKLLNYFIQYRLKNLMNSIGDF